MSNFIVSFEEIKKVLDAISRVSNPKAVSTVILGKTPVGQDYACAIKVVGGAEEVMVKFLAKIQGDFEKPLSFSVENSSLTGILTALSNLKESVCIGAKDSLALFGVPGKAMMSLPTLGEDDIPAGVSLDKDSQITRFYVKQDAMMSLLRGGGFATANNDDGGRGVSNATLIVKDGKLVLYSCNETGSLLGYSECDAEMADVPTADGASNKRLDFCKEKGIENLIVPIPKKVIINLLGLLDGDKKCSFVITDKVIMMAPNDATQYLAVLGAKSFVGGAQLIDKISQVPTKGIAIVDNEKLKTNLSMIQSFISLSAKKNSAPVEIKFGKKNLILAQTNGDGKVVIDLVASSFEVDDSKLLDAERLNNVINVLGKGNVRIEARDGEGTPLFFTNGSLTEVNGATKAVLAPVMKQAEAEETK